MTLVLWLGILFCISQSAIFSGLNLAYFSVSRLRLEVEKEQGNSDAEKVLEMRNDSNFILTTILWGNVGINVLLTLLSSRVLFGVAAFLFSTVFITLIGEILPQAYFSRHALKMASLLRPILKLYQILLYPCAKPTAKLLDAWLGPEGIHFYKERELRNMIKLHLRQADSEIDLVEGIGALNFLHLDDILVKDEGEIIDPQSIISFQMSNNSFVFPEYSCDPNDPFLSQVQLSGKKWVIITNEENWPIYALDAHLFLRKVLFSGISVNPIGFCHKPIVISDPATPLERIITLFKVNPMHREDDVVDDDLIILWSSTKRIITGADILGRLLRGIVKIHPVR